MGTTQARFGTIFYWGWRGWDGGVGGLGLGDATYTHFLMVGVGWVGVGWVGWVGLGGW